MKLTGFSSRRISKYCKYAGDLKIMPIAPHGNNPIAPLNSPAGGGGPGYFRSPRQQGVMGLHALADASNSVVPPKDKGNLESRQVQLNIYGQFEQGPWKTDAQILASINKNTAEWSPGKNELLIFARSGKGVVEPAVNVWNLLCAIKRHRPGRVNIFTHANDGYIALSGKVVPGNVLWNVKDQYAVFDGEVISLATQPGFTFSDSKSKGVTLAQVRDALGKNAEVVIYACHAGLDGLYLKQIANVLRVTVKGFKEEIRYYPVPSTDAKRIESWRYSVGSHEKVADFHDLDRYATSIPPDPS